MDIDLLFTQAGEAGLICSKNLAQKAAGVVFDTQTGVMTLEFVDMDFMELNIPVEADFFAALDLCPQVHIGAIKDGKIAQAYQAPFMFLDDPYRSEAFQAIEQDPKPLLAFEYFVKGCTAGQPVHRDDLGNEETMGCILGDASPAALQFAPHLARRHALEASPKPMPGNAPGLGLGSGGSTSPTGTPSGKNKKSD